MCVPITEVEIDWQSVQKENEKYDVIYMRHGNGITGQFIKVEKPDVSKTKHKITEYVIDGEKVKVDE